MSRLISNTPSSRSSDSAPHSPTSPVKRSDETLDALFHGRLKILQSRSGYRFSLDAVLLSYFVDIRAGETVVDLGSGNGVIPLILGTLHTSLSVTGVEIQEGMAERAIRNIHGNGLEERVTMVCGDVCDIQRLLGPESADFVVCNPPYRARGSGRMSFNRENKIARHEIAASLQDFVRAAAYLLPRKGRMALIHPVMRMPDLFQAMRSIDIHPTRMRMVHSFADNEATLVLIEGVKGGRSELKVLPPLVVYEKGQKYMPEIRSMLSGDWKEERRPRKNVNYGRALKKETGPDFSAT